MSNENGKVNRKSKRYVIFTIHSSQVSSSIGRGHSLPTYDKYWLYYFCMEQLLFHELYDNWVNSGYVTELKPSVDRIIESEPYTQENIQLMTFEENRNKGHMAVVNGILQRSTTPIEQYSLSGILINTFPSIAVASKLLSIKQCQIQAVADKKKYRKTAGGFKFKRVNYE